MIHGLNLPFRPRKLITLACGLLFLILAPAPMMWAEDLGTRLTQALSTAITNAPLTVGVGNFLYQDTPQMSAFSAVLQAQVETALAQTPPFELVSRDQMVITQLFHGALPLDPGQPIGTGNSTSITALVRGRFFLQDTNISVTAELVRLADGKILARVTNTGAANIPATQDFVPANFALGQDNIRDVEKRLAALPHDFVVDLSIKQCKRNFARGERYELRIRAPQDCYVAVFDHEVDGSTVLLFPNSRHTNDWVPADVAVDIPSPDDHVLFLKVSPPLGADVIQVIACTSESTLHKNMVRAAASSANVVTMLAPVSREQLAGQISRINSAAEPKSDAKWAEAHLVLSSYAGPAQPTNKATGNLKDNFAPGLGIEPPVSK
jgi:Domain of unknown function (DUF4384)